MVEKVNHDDHDVEQQQQITVEQQHQKKKQKTSAKKSLPPTPTPTIESDNDEPEEENQRLEEVSGFFSEEDEREDQENGVGERHVNMTKHDDDDESDDLNGFELDDDDEEQEEHGEIDDEEIVASSEDDTQTLPDAQHRQMIRNLTMKMSEKKPREKKLKQRTESFPESEHNLTKRMTDLIALLLILILALFFVCSK
jgi:hypothetical protein